MRNGETSKTIDFLDLEAPKMDQEQIEDYLRFCDERDIKKGLVTKRDRKTSSEFFKTENERLNKIMEQKTPPKSKFAQLSTKEKSKFTCYKRSLVVRKDLDSGIEFVKNVSLIYKTNQEMHVDNLNVKSMVNNEH